MKELFRGRSQRWVEGETLPCKVCSVGAELGLWDGWRLAQSGNVHEH